MAHGRDPISHPVDDDDSDLGSATPDKSWGNLRAGNHLATRRQALDDWRYNCWKRDYWFCTFGEVGVMPDAVLSTLASSVKIETVDELVEVVPRWGYARKYSHEVLSTLKDASHKHKLESQTQRVKVKQETRKRKRGDPQRDGEQEPLQVLVQPHAVHTVLPTSANTRMIVPIIVKHIENPTRLQVSRPQPQTQSLPRPQPSHLQPQPVLISRPYTRTDIFDVLMDNSRHM